MNYELHHKVRFCGCKICEGTFTVQDFASILNRRERRRLMARAIAAPKLVERMELQPVIHKPGAFGEILE